MVISFDGIVIHGVAGAVPLNASALEDGSGTKAEKEIAKKFARKGGVTSRFVSGPNQTSADLCYAAAKALIEGKGIDTNEIGVVVMVTQTADYRSPATAAMLQYRLGLSESCIAFDVDLGCSGFTCGMGIAGSILSNSDCRYALLLCGETPAREKDPRYTRLTSNADKMLFGDAGTATLLEKCERDAAHMRVSSMTRGAGYKNIINPYGFYRHPAYPSDDAAENVMDGMEVFNFATTDATKMILDYLRDMGSRPEDYDCLVLHQANKFIMDRIVKLTGFSPEQSLVSIDRFGNTSSASIPVSLVDRYGKSGENRELRVLACGYGVGLSWSCEEFRVNEADILPLVQTDEYFEDGF